MKTSYYIFLTIKLITDYVHSVVWDLNTSSSTSFAPQGCRFEISAVGSLCLPKLVYYSPSAFHSKHVLKHLIDTHRFHISTRDAASYIQQLEDMEGQQQSDLQALSLS